MPISVFFSIFNYFFYCLRVLSWDQLTAETNSPARGLRAVVTPHSRGSPDRLLSWESSPGVSDLFSTEKGLIFHWRGKPGWSSHSTHEGDRPWGPPIRLSAGVLQASTPLTTRSRRAAPSSRAWGRLTRRRHRGSRQGWTTAVTQTSSSLRIRKQRLLSKSSAAHRLGLFF